MYATFYKVSSQLAFSTVHRETIRNTLHCKITIVRFIHKRCCNLIPRPFKKFWINFSRHYFCKMTAEIRNIRLLRNALKAKQNASICHCNSFKNRLIQQQMQRRKCSHALRVVKSVNKSTAAQNDVAFSFINLFTIYILCKKLHSSAGMRDVIELDAKGI